MMNKGTIFTIKVTSPMRIVRYCSIKILVYLWIEAHLRNTQILKRCRHWIVPRKLWIRTEIILIFILHAELAYSLRKNRSSTVIVEFSQRRNDRLVVHVLLNYFTIHSRIKDIFCFQFIASWQLKCFCVTGRWCGSISTLTRHATRNLRYVL